MPAAIDLDRALLDPAAVFSAPEDVLLCDGLTVEQKRDVLRRWQYDAVELAVASDEGMAGPDNGLHSRVLAALHQLEMPNRANTPT